MKSKSDSCRAKGKAMHAELSGKMPAMRSGGPVKKMAAGGAAKVRRGFANRGK